MIMELRLFPCDARSAKVKTYAVIRAIRQSGITIAGSAGFILSLWKKTTKIDFTIL